MTDYKTREREATPVGDDMLWYRPTEPPRSRRRGYATGEPCRATGEPNVTTGDYRTIPSVTMYPTSSAEVIRGMCPWCRVPHSLLWKWYRGEEWECFTIWGVRWPDAGGWCPDNPDRIVNVTIRPGTAATVRMAA